MKALKEKFETSVHALALKTFTPEKWESEKHKYKGVNMDLTEKKKKYNKI